MSKAIKTHSRELIRDAGLRATPARVATLDLLRDAPSPLAHAEVAENLANICVDKATVFRALNDMTKNGLLRRTELGDRVWRFESLSEEQHKHSTHLHFVCADCGQVSCLVDFALTNEILATIASVGNVTEILLKGQCANCV